MKNITRSIITEKVWGVVLDSDGNPLETEPVFIKGTSFKETDYRNALKRSGVTMRHNMVIRHEVVATERYECTVEDFLRVAVRC